MIPYKTWNNPCAGCTDRVLLTKEHPYTCHATCQRYKDAKETYEASRKGIRKQKNANSCVWHYLHKGDKNFMDCLNFGDGVFPWENFGSGHVVTHWMPLPEPPKED